MFALMDLLVNESSVVQCSDACSEAARTPLSDTRSDNESLNAANVVGLESGHQRSTSTDARGVARINPVSDVDCNSE